MNNTVMAVDDNAALKDVYADNDYAKTILDDFASRANNQKVTRVDQIMSRLRKDELPRWAVTSLFKKLHELNYGRFVIGRRGRPSRFEWSASSADVGKAAQGKAVTIAPAPEEGEQKGDFIVHHFNLRPEIAITIELPADFTEKEADRLSNFLRALPM